MQAEADRNKRAVPEFVTEADGKGKVESFTVLYRPQRRGRARRGHAAHRGRTRARWRACPPTMRATLAHLLDMDRTPVGSLGDITMAEDGVPEWRVG